MIVKTKLFRPVSKASALPRARLNERLAQVERNKLTLLSAPAGFGKSFLVADWSRCLCHCSWLSLDENDAHTESFLRYFVAAIRHMSQGLGEEAWQLLQQQGPVDAKAVVSSLLNELSYFDDPVTLILDDYHLCETPSLNDFLNQFIERLPPHIHLVIITRADPALALAKLRVQGELLEIRAADLRFSDQEAMQLFRLQHGVMISEYEAMQVNQKTEGWVAGLQLSALALMDNAEAEDLIARFSGSHHYVLDYLTEEVLSRMPTAVRHFLLATAQLKELSADFCDVLLGTHNSGEMLAYLEKHNVFLIALDNERGWYRYHHLFADVLVIHAKHQSQEAQVIYWRAALWYAEQRRLADAVYYAQACQSQDKLLSLINDYWPSCRHVMHDSELIHWLRPFALASIQVYPVLAGYYGLALLSHDAEKGVMLLHSTRAFFEGKSDPLTSVEKTVFGIVNIGEAYIHAAQGDSAGVLSRVDKALQVLPADEAVWRGSSRALAGIALWRDGQLADAEQNLIAAVANMDNSHDQSAKVTSRFLLADYYYQFGWLAKAKHIVQAAVAIADQQTGYSLEGAADAYLLWAEIELDLGREDKALQLLDSAQQFGTLGAMPEAQYRYPLLEARIAMMNGDNQKAQALLVAAQSLYQSPPNPCHRPPQYWQTLHRLNNGLEFGLPAQDVPLTDAPHINGDSYFLSALHHPHSLAKQQAHFAELAAVHNAPRLQFIHYALSAALAEQQANHDELLLWQQRLKQVQSEQLGANWHQDIKVLAADAKAVQSNSLAPSSKVEQEGLVEALSKKEMQVLQWLDTELTGPQIAAKLFVSLNTLRTHTKNIYAKLGVNNRRSAINAAKAHHLIRAKPS